MCITSVYNQNNNSIGVFMETAIKSKRIDIILPVGTLEQIDHIWSEFGFTSRSSFIDEAAKRFAIRLKKADIKRKLKAGYFARAERDVALDRELEILSLAP
jgi:metal-responsive CopG/Arc/MetJ family transcriptional regulator